MLSCFLFLVLLGSLFQPSPFVFRSIFPSAGVTATLIATQHRGVAAFFFLCSFLLLISVVSFLSSHFIRYLLLALFVSLVMSSHFEHPACPSSQLNSQLSAPVNPLSPLPPPSPPHLPPLSAGSGHLSPNKLPSTTSPIVVAGSDRRSGRHPCRHSLLCKQLFFLPSARTANSVLLFASVVYRRPS